MRAFVRALGIIFFIWLSPAAVADTARTAEALAAIGCYEGSFDDIKKLKLRTAIRCFQKSQNLQPTGNLTSSEESRLFELAASGDQVEKKETYSPTEIRGDQLPSFSKVATRSASPERAERTEAKLRHQIEQVRSNSSEECAQFFEWVLPLQLEYSEHVDIISQSKSFKRTGKIVPFVRLFEDENLESISGFHRMSARRFDGWHKEVTRCLGVRYGENSREYGSYVIALNYVKGLKEFRHGERGIKSNPIENALPKLEEYRAASSELLNEIKNTGREKWRRGTYSRLANELYDIEQALWPSSVEEHRRLLDEIKVVAEKTEEEQRVARKNRALSRVASQVELCMSLADPEDPALPDGTLGVYELPEDIILQHALEACKIAIEGDRKNPIFRFSVGRLNLALSRDTIAKLDFEKAANRGSAAALAYLADLEEDPEIALSLFQQAAEKGFAPAEQMSELLEQHVAELKELEVASLTQAYELIEQCDLAAAHPLDPDKPANIAGIEDTDVDFDVAFAACTAALEVAPEHLRTNFNLGRILSLVDELQEEAKVYLSASANAGHAPSAFYLANITGRRAAVPLIERAAAAGFLPATNALPNLIRYPKNPDLRDIFAEPTQLSDVALSVTALEVKSFSVDRCVNQIFHRVREERFFENDFVALVQGFNAAVCVSAGGVGPYCNAWNNFSNTAKNDARQICVRQQRSFLQDYPVCLQPYWSVQNEVALQKSPVFARRIVSAYHAAPGGFDEKAAYFDSAVGELTDLATILYFSEVGLNLSEIWGSDLDENGLLKDTVDTDLRNLVAELKASNKYEIALNMIPRDVLCEEAL